MRRFFCPDEFADSFMDVDYRRLFDGGIRGLLFDVDNTLEGYEAAVPSERTAGFLLSLRDMGFEVCFVSNNGRQRIETFNAELGFCAIHKSGKPGKKAALDAAALINVPIHAAAIIGDQIFTDVWCGRRAGIYTVLVLPVTNFDPPLVRLKRIIERPLVRYYKKHCTSRQF